MAREVNSKKFRENRSDPSYTPNHDARGDSVNYGQIIRIYREAQHISQKQISIDLGFSQNQVGYWERGITVPHTQMVVPICKYLHIPINEFLGIDDDTNKLTEDEIRLIACFRCLPDDNIRDAVLQILDRLSSVYQ